MMNFEIKKMSVDLLDDWLHFFDHVGFSDDGDWPGCYCMCYHWNNQLDRRYNWNNEVENRSNSRNRERAIKLIKSGIMQGYLAYNDGNVVGWCNANEKRKYNTVNFEFPWEESEKNEKIKAIVCFCVAPKLRKKGIASQLLKKVYLDAAKDGYRYIEAYPFTKGDNNNYHGPLNLYKNNGFKTYGNIYGCTIVRKYL
ncbi:MAG: GNAT family N-acetyltransferase [Treponema sp.]|jgi:GNAT superfamily N-acetyltransferase|nr:GNAT family N-acetyltransferase [Treponema sp.]